MENKIITKNNNHNLYLLKMKNDMNIVQQQKY